MSKPHFERIALIGLGLIGSSISHAARAKGLCNEIVGTARSAQTRETAKRIGLITESFETAAQAVKGADLVILCTPVGTYERLGAEIAQHMAPGTILTDVGSVKTAVVEALEPNTREDVHLIPGHPVAGTEQSGPESGFAELFENRWCILTPPDDADQNAVSKLDRFWRALGSEVEIMTPEHHDLVLAITSHIPHLIAFNIVNTAEHLKRVTEKEVVKYSAGGFRDFTRIAASDPVMWRDVFLNNKDATLHMLGRFSQNLDTLRQAIVDDDADTLHKLFTEARTLRRGIIETGQDTDEPDFGRREKKS